MAKNKQPNGQTFGPKMARALLLRVNSLEDCVISQQKVISQLESQIANDNLGHQLMKKRYEEMLTYVELKRPDVERLIKAQTKRKAVQIATGGALPDIKLTVVKRKRKVKVPEAQPVFTLEEQAIIAEHIAEHDRDLEEGETHEP